MIVKVFIDKDCFNVEYDTTSITISSILNILRQQNRLKYQDDELYAFYNRTVHPITPQTTLEETFVIQRSILLLISRVKYEKLKKLSPALESAALAAQELSQQNYELIVTIGHIKSFVDNYYKGETFDKLLSAMPIDQMVSESAEENLKVLTHWFKTEFFTFVHNAKCKVCGNETQGTGSTYPTEYEAQGYANRVELYKCSKCGAVTRFPRYDNPERLLETRKGRCAEFANVFTGMLLAFGFDARIVVDLTDHVWSEVWLDDKQRYVHVDPCEDIVDAPYTYEVGWGKKLTWIFAIGPHEIRDVTRKYTKNYNAVLARRSPLVSEEWLTNFLKFRNAQWRVGVSKDIIDDLDAKHAKDEASMLIDRDSVKPEEQRTRISGNE